MEKNFIFDQFWYVFQGVLILYGLWLFIQSFIQRRRKVLQEQKTDEEHNKTFARMTTAKALEINDGSRKRVRYVHKNESKQTITSKNIGSHSRPPLKIADDPIALDIDFDDAHNNRRRNENDFMSIRSNQLSDERIAFEQSKMMGPFENRMVLKKQTLNIQSSESLENYDSEK